MSDLLLFVCFLKFVGNFRNFCGKNLVVDVVMNYVLPQNAKNFCLAA